MGLVQRVQYFTSFNNLRPGKDSAILEDVVQYAFENTKKIFSYFASDIMFRGVQQTFIHHDTCNGLAAPHHYLNRWSLISRAQIRVMCAVLNGSWRYHLPTWATLNYPICQNGISLLSKVLKALAKGIDVTRNEGNTPFISFSHQPCKTTQKFI